MLFHISSLNFISITIVDSISNNGNLVFVKKFQAEIFTYLYIPRSHESKKIVLENVSVWLYHWTIIIIIINQPFFCPLLNILQMSPVFSAFCIYYSVCWYSFYIIRPSRGGLPRLRTSSLGLHSRSFFLSICHPPS